jgi:hypothetical protein
VPFHPVPPAADQEPEPVLESVEQLRRGECAGACGGELDGQRHPVEATTDLGDVLLPSGQVEVRVEGDGALREELGTGSCGVQWRQRDELLGPDGQRLPGGGQHVDVGALVDECPAGGGRTVGDVLAVVEDQRVTVDEQVANLGLLGKLNALSGIEYPDDMNLRARIQSYELAFQMQTAVPELMSLDREPEHVRHLYGLDVNECKTFGSQLLAARRMVERGVRFVQVFHGYNGGAGRWDNHANLAKSMPNLAREVDQPVSGLIRDLKQLGMLDDTLVVWGTEFGRTPGAEFRNASMGTGRDHHPHGFTCWLAGGGVKGGTVHGATDELGFHAVEHRHYVTDLHATVLHQLGLDPHRLEVPGRKRLEKDFGEAITGILA